VWLPPLGAWSWSGPGLLPGTDRGFSVDDEFQAYPLSCENFPKPSPVWERHAGSLEALRVTRPETVDLVSIKKRQEPNWLVPRQGTTEPMPSRRGGTL